jgi:hypothetical protein
VTAARPGRAQIGVIDEAMNARRTRGKPAANTERRYVMNKLHLLTSVSLVLATLALVNGAEAGTKGLTKEPVNLLAPASAASRAEPNAAGAAARDYTFTLNSFKITNTRSLHNDTDFVAMAVAVGSNAPIILPAKSMGDLNNGSYKVNMSIPNALVGSKQAVAFSYSIVNTGYDQNTVEQALKKAVSALAQKAAEAGAEAASTALGGDPTTGKAIEDAVGPTLIGKLTSVIFADCDGTVAVGKHVFSGAQLAAETANGAVLSKTDNNPGTDSATGCGRQLAILCVLVGQGR